MKVKNLEKMLDYNKTIIIEIHDLKDKLTSTIAFEFDNGQFKAMVGNTDYELISLLGNCEVKNFSPCVFNRKMCLNITVNISLEDKEEILLCLGLK